MEAITIFWFRQDLRLADNPGLIEAVKMGTVMPIYILDEASAGEWCMGEASRWWLHHALISLNEQLDNNLNVYVGNALEVLRSLCKKNPIQAVYWNRGYEPWRIQLDSKIKTALKENNITAKSFNGSLLWEPWEVLKKDGTPYKVYTPFYRNGCLQAPPPRHPLPAPKKAKYIKDTKALSDIASLGLLPTLNWYESFVPHWEIGEKAAQKKLKYFLNKKLLGYKKNRDFPEQKAISTLSPHLHFGEISPNQVWYSAQAKAHETGWDTDTGHFLSELAWREFSYSLLYHYPDIPFKNIQSKFDNFPWKKNAKHLKAWQQGQTGYPIIDAGMRELWQTGFMHNRVRMIVASFLIKNLLIHWHEGEKWFWDCLVDADLANNSASWQWVAGSGMDAAPYFRIFNPITQGEKFDVEGEYTRKFVPELQKLPNKYLFKPWEAPENILSAAGVVLGKTYPHPIVDLATTRASALAAYKML